MKNILIVDDYATNREQIREFLEKTIFLEKTDDIYFSTAYNYAVTRTKLKERMFHIVMLDAHICDNAEGEQFSYKLISEIKNNNNDAIIVMCSNNTAWNVAGVEQGATTILDKSRMYYEELFEQEITDLKNLLTT